MPGTSWTRSAAGVTFLAPTTARERIEPLVGDRGHAEVGLAVLAAAAGERGEQRRLAGPGGADDADLERHAVAGVLAAGAEADAALAGVALDEGDHPDDDGVAAVVGLEGDRLGLALDERALELVERVAA